MEHIDDIAQRRLSAEGVILKAKPIYSMAFAVILVVTIMLAVRIAAEKNKQPVILDYLGREYLHIERIDEARENYTHISTVTRKNKNR